MGTGRCLSIAITASLILLGSIGAHAGQAGLDPAKERGIRGQIAETWLELARWCLARKLGEQARLCAGIAEAADPSAQALPALKEAAAKAPDAGSDLDRLAWKTKHGEAAKKTAKSYEDLFSMAPRAADSPARERLEECLLAAIEFQATERRWADAASLAETASAGKDPQRALRIAERALSLKPPAKLVPKFQEVVRLSATGRFVLKTCASHPIRYYLSLPSGFKKNDDKKWPVLLVLGDSGLGDYEETGKLFEARRGDSPFLIVAPCYIPNHALASGGDLNDDCKRFLRYYPRDLLIRLDRRGLGWSLDGMQSILGELRADFDAEDRAYATGYNLGGFILWVALFRNPGLLKGAAPVCCYAGTWNPQEFLEKHQPEELSIPIHVFLGELDPRLKVREDPSTRRLEPGIENETDDAIFVLGKIGCKNVKRTTVPGVVMGPCADQVLKALRPFIDGLKKTQDPLD